MIKAQMFIPDSVIERKALEMLRAYETNLGQSIVLPIKIEDIVERHLDLRIDWDEIPETDEPILGCLDPDARKIYMNTKHVDYFERYHGTERYTLAHEIGHWDLHILTTDIIQQSLFDEPAHEPYLCRSAKYDSRELQAEKYAAYITMPRHLIVHMIKEQDIYSWSVLYKLKDLFGVTITALTKRLRELGLIYVAEKKIYHSEAEYRGIKPSF